MHLSLVAVIAPGFSVALVAGLVGLVALVEPVALVALVEPVELAVAELVAELAAEPAAGLVVAVTVVAGLAAAPGTPAVAAQWLGSILDPVDLAELSEADSSVAAGVLDCSIDFAAPVAGVLAEFEPGLPD